MARIRTIKPEFFRSRSLAQLDPEVRLTFAGLWTEADDDGHGIADPRLLKGALWPLDDACTHLHVSSHLDVLAASGHIRLYEVAGESYYEVVNWSKHQAAAYRRGEPKYPGPDDPAATISHVDVQESAGRTQKRAGREGNREGKGNPFVATDVATKKKAPNYTDEFETFWDAYPRHPANGKPGGGGTKAEAWIEWRKLTDEDRLRAIEACEPHAVALRKSDTPPKHACRFLKYREFDDVLEVSTPRSAICATCRGEVGPRHDDLYCEELKAGKQVGHG